jgi:hypothetical protein
VLLTLGLTFPGILEGHFFVTTVYSLFGIGIGAMLIGAVFLIGISTALATKEVRAGNKARKEREHLK